MLAGGVKGIYISEEEDDDGNAVADACLNDDLCGWVVGVRDVVLVSPECWETGRESTPL